jgi:hypothetical protein
MPTTLLVDGVRFNDGSIQFANHSIRSVQNIFTNPKGTVAGGDFPLAINVTISAVNTTKAFILCPNVAETTTTYVYRLLSAKFLNSTTVQLCCDNSSTVSFHNIRFQVVEFI